MAEVNDPPPAYSRDQQVEGQIAMAKAFNSPDVQSSLQIDIEKFTQTVNSVTKSFDVVERKLGEIDALGLDAKKFQPEWIKFKKRYRDYVWESRDIATRVATDAEQFGTAMLPIVGGEFGGTIGMALIQLRFFIKRSEQQGKEAENIAKKFDGLAEEISEFRATFSTFAEKQLQDANKELETLRARLSALDKELESVNGKIIGLSVGLGVVIFASIALCIVFPVAAPKIAAAGVAAATSLAGALGVAVNERQKIVSEIAEKSARVQQLAETVKSIEHARAELRLLGETEISNIIGGLHMLSDIWRNVKADAAAIESYLGAADAAASLPDYAKDPNAPAVIVSYVKSSLSIYSGLAKALRLYASGIVASTVKPS